MGGPLREVAPGFVALAHVIVYATIGTVDTGGRPRNRIMHPIWEWDGERLVGRVGTTPSPKLGHLAAVPHVSVAYVRGWQAEGVAECHAVRDDTARRRVWDLFAAAEPPLGFRPGRHRRARLGRAGRARVRGAAPRPLRVRTRTMAPPEPPDVRVWHTSG